MRSQGLLGAKGQPLTILCTPWAKSRRDCPACQRACPCPALHRPRVTMLAQPNGATRSSNAERLVSMSYRLLLPLRFAEAASRFMLAASCSQTSCPYTPHLSCLQGYIIKQRTPSTCSALEAVCTLAGLQPPAAAQLIRLGAVFLGEEIKGQDVVKWRRLIDLCATQPALPPTSGTTASSALQPAVLPAAAAAQAEAGQASTAASVRREAVALAADLDEAGDDPCAWQCTTGQLLRIHPFPKRFPACDVADWPARLLAVDADYVVINKPAGLPSMRHESNGVEHVAACAARALGLGLLQVCRRHTCTRHVGS